MKSRNKRLLWAGTTLLFLVVLGATFWVLQFRHYTPAEALKDLRAAAAVGNTPKPVERYIELRYGPQSDPENRLRAFLDFFNVGHIEGMFILVNRMEPGWRQVNIDAMAKWVANYRCTMSPEEKSALKKYAQSDAGRSSIQEATKYYLSLDVRIRVASAEVISELLKTLAEVQKE